MTSNKPTFFALLLIACLGIFLSSTLQAQQPEPIGLMLSTVGVVTAEDQDGNVRRLQRRSPVYEGDTLITANRARAQIRFNDRGLIALQPNTSFFIEQHEFNGQEDGTESAIYSLLRGGLQAITGLIGHSNRDRYQVSTPIATIGLRGTHWAATFCTTECDGNAPGLYGGVADGGIDVCNGGGCTAVETNTYFYTPNANTRATTLLAPPSVVFAANDDDEEDDDNNNDSTVASNTDDSNTDDPDDGETPTTQATSNVASFVETAGAGTTTQTTAQITTINGLDDPADLIAERQEDIVEEEVTAATQTTPAPAGSVVALASARGNPDNADQSAALEILVYPTGDSPGNDDFVTPIAGFVDAIDPANETQTTTALGALSFDLSQAGCDPCLYATAGLQGTSATLVESIETSVEGMDIFLGRWRGDALLFNNSGGDLNALQDHHYAIALADSGFAFSPALPSAEIPEIAVYSLLQATAPTDQASNTGSLDSFDLYMDLYMQLVTRMDISIFFEDREIEAGLVNAFAFAEGAVAGLSAPLAGTCSGDGCGTSSLFGATSLSFIGDSSEHILGSYALDSLELDQSVFGAYLLGLEETFNPLQVNDLVGTEVSENFGLLAGIEQVGDLFQPILADLSVLSGSTGFAELVNLYDTPNVLAAQNSASMEFDVIDGELIERGSFDFNSSTFHYGTWRLTDFIYAENGQALATNETFNYLYTLGALPESYSLKQPFVHSYSYLGGPSPVDENGELGQITSIDLGLDIWRQTVDYFEMELEIAARLYVADLISVADLAEVVAGSPLLLSGTCTGGDCSAAGEVLTGSANLSLFYGEASYGAVGSFGLQTRPIQDQSIVVSTETFDGVQAVVVSVPPSEHTASGLFVLEGAQDEHPDYISDPQGVITQGVAAVSVTGTDGVDFAPLGTSQSSDTAAIGLTSVGNRDNVLVSYEDIDEPEGEGGLFNLNAGVLERFDETESFIADNGVDSSSSDFYLNIGRWSILDADLTIDSDSIPTTTVGHFAYSDAPTNLDALLANPFEFGAPILTYSLVDSTRPSDESDNLGQLISADLEVDLYHQLISDFSMQLSIADRTMNAWIYESAMLGDNDIRLMGECVGGDCSTSTDLVGEFSFGFVGDQAEGVIGNFGLFAGNTFPVDSEVIYSDVSANGVFVLARDSVEPHPDYVEGSGFALASSGIAALSTTVVMDSLYAPTGSTEATPLVEIGLVDLGSRTDLVVDFLSLDGAPGEGGSFSVNQALLRQHGRTAGFIAANQITDELGLISTSSDFDISLGRWELIDTDFILDGNLLDIRPEAHFAFSDAATNMQTFVANPFSLQAPIVSYSLVDATAPTDQNGNLGELQSAYLEVDLFLQLISDFSMDLVIEDTAYVAYQYEPTYIGDGLDYGGIKLAGYCYGGQCDSATDLLGFAGLGFLGDTGEGVIGNYQLVEDLGVAPVDELAFGGISANGVFVLARDSVVQNPDWFGPNDANTPASLHSGLVGASHILENEGDTFLEAAQVGFLVDEDGDNSFSTFDSRSALHSYSFQDKDEDEVFALVESGALLVEEGGYIFGDNLVKWGQWFSPDGFDIAVDGNSVPTGSYSHYAWSDGVKTDFSLLPVSPETAHYSYEGGTSPTDALGNQGHVNEIYLDLDLFQQAIVDFGLDFEIAERSYLAGLDPADSTYFLSKPDIELELFGTCTGAECGEGVGLEGETSLMFVGDTSGVETFDHIAGVIGSFALEVEPEDEFEEFIPKDLIIAEDYFITELSIDDPEFNLANIGATGSYFLLGEAFENPLYFDLSSASSRVPSSEGVAAIATSYTPMYSSIQVGTTEILGESTGDLVYLMTLDGISNLVAGADSFSSDMYGSYREDFDIDGAVIAEHGGFASFLADNGLSGSTDFGVNWGRWFGGAFFEESIFDVSSGDYIDQGPESLGENHHFIFTDGPSGIFPTFVDPTEARYRYVGGPSPTDELGRTGYMDASMTLDLFLQTMTGFEMELEIADRFYYAEYRDYYQDPLGLDFEDLFEEEIHLRGACIGGSCDVGDYYYYFADNLQLEGSLSLLPIGANGEGFIGSFELQELSSEYSLYTGISAIGSFVLAQDETQPHIGWQVNPEGIAASAPEVAVLTGTLEDSTTTQMTWHSFAGVLDPSSGDSFTTIDIEGKSVLDSVTSGDSACDVCSFEIQDAVLIDRGEVYHPYQYLLSSSDVNWGTWLNRDLTGNDWLFDGSSTPLDSMRLANYVHADNLISQADLNALSMEAMSGGLPTLTGYDSIGYYSYAGGPAPVTQYIDYEGVALEDMGKVQYLNASIDFYMQTLQDVQAQFFFGGDSFYDAETTIYLHSDSYDSVALAPIMEISLIGSCNGCGVGSIGTENFDGNAVFAIVGDRAEQLIGGIEAWSNDSNPYGTGVIGSYTLENAFVLNQEFDDNWVESIGGRVTQPALAALAPTIGVNGTGYAPVSLLIVDDGFSETVQLELTDYFHEDLSGQDPLAVFSGYSSGSEFFDIENGYLDDSDRSYGGYGYGSSYSGTAPWFIADWGIWDSQSIDFNLATELSEFSSVENAMNTLPFVASYDITTSLPSGIVTGGSGSVASFNYLNGPGTVSAFASYFGYVESVLMTFDFATASVIDFYLSAYDGYYNRYEAEMTAATSLASTDTSFQIDLVGICEYCGSGSETVSGYSLFSFLGDNAEGAAGSFALSGASDTLAGAYVLHQNDHWMDQPDTFVAQQGSVAAFASINSSANEGNSFGFVIDETNTADLLTVQSFDHTHPNALAGFDVSGTPCGSSCSWDMTQGELRNYDNTQAPHLSYLPEAYWGRWESQDDLTKEGVETALTQYQHFVYSPDASNFDDDVWATDIIADYAYVAGTNPTDNFGNQGSIYDMSVNMTVNFQAQKITDFDLAASVNGYDYVANMQDSEALLKKDGSNTPFANFDLIGDVSNANTLESYTNAATGNASVLMLGVEADAALGAFDLTAPVINHAINGTFLLEQTTVISP